MPTRGSFAGTGHEAAKAILAGHPLITSPVVPALEVLRPACVAARTDDVDSYVEGVLKLISDREYYESLCRACTGQGEPFYDRKQGLTAVLRRVIEPLKDRNSGGLALGILWAGTEKWHAGGYRRGGVLTDQIAPRGRMRRQRTPLHRRALHQLRPHGFSR